VAITERVIRLPGSTHTVLTATPDLPEPFVRDYGAAVPGATLRDVTASNPYVPWTAGAMYSTRDDLRVWVMGLANGSLLSPEMPQQRLTMTPFAGEGLDVRYGLGVLSINGLTGHSGGIFSYGSWTVHAPKEDATIVVLTNPANTAGGGSDLIFIQIVQLLFPERFDNVTSATPASATPSI